MMFYNNLAVDYKQHMVGNNALTTASFSAPQKKAEPRTSTKGNTLGGQITEIVLQQHDLSAAPILLPLLALLSGDQRWLAWIAPPTELPKVQLKMAGIELHKVMLLEPHSVDHQLDLAEKALAAGTCQAAAILISHPLNSHQLNRLENAAIAGDSHCIIIRQRNRS